MRKSTLVGGLAAALASMVLVLPPPASAAPGGGGGTGDIYADLVIALRDVDGVPKTVNYGGVACVQPVSYSPIPSLTPIPPITPVLNDVDGRMVYLVPLIGAVSVVDPTVVCDPQPEYAAFVSEVDLERLNLARTSDAVIQRKLDEVQARLLAATQVTLDGAGRITTWTGIPPADPSPIDASPDHAAIYQSLMNSGTIPGLPVPAVVPLGATAWIPQEAGGFDQWMLAAASIGTAAGKSVPITIDTVQYYNRIAAPTGGVGDWVYAPVLLPPQVVNGEQFVDYSDFSYTRSEVFQGCTTWLDVATLTWQVDYVRNRVEFTDIVAGAASGPVNNIAGFTQLADDVRSVINYLHDNEVVVNPKTGEGFFIDPVFTDTCTDQMETAVRLNTPVDAVDPTVTITAAPASTTTATDARFEFTATDAASVLCVLDGGALERCLSPKTYAGLEPGSHTFTVIAMGVAGNFVSDSRTWQVIPPGEDSMIASFTPVRLADTRPGWVAADGLFVGTGPVPGGQFVQVSVANRGGVPAGATAAVLNVTVVSPAGDGYATVFPCGTVPSTSSLNYSAGEDVANEVITKLSPTGTVCVFTYSTANIIVDVAGFVPALSDYVPMSPVRLADTRAGWVAADGLFAGTGPVAGGQFVQVPVAGRAGVPADAKAVVVNVTSVSPAGGGYLTVFPCGTLPYTSSLNYSAGEDVATEVIAKLSPTGAICVFTYATASIIVDVAGYVPAGSDYVGLDPVRLADTRAGWVAADGLFAGTGPVAGGQVVQVPVAGRGGVPVGARAVVANVTIADPVAGGYATVFPCGTLPYTSSLNYSAGEAVANEVIAKLSPTGAICVFTYSTANIIVDVAGYL